MLISPASVMEISIALAGVIASVAACLHGSKCSRIKCCGCEITREVGNRTNNETSDEEIELPTIPSGH
jgi:hypothetical protein